MAKMVTLTIDGQVVSAPEGMLVVDAARKIGVDIPVFCYHPKMEPVGMCRMCLVEIGRPVIDRASGQPVLEANGEPRIQFGPKLETACTTPVQEGMVVRGMSEKVQAARREVLEFLLTSHPLDCPICDKGGECPLQNLTMGFGPGQSRFLLDEKQRSDKHVPLGELIYLDRERCIQCGRCVRFQSEVVGEPVIGFYQRGRALEIVTCSQPGFDSVFSGNTTDICPVGALTSADFRFGARPWELKPAASLCSHCAVGCNLTLNVRREARTDGQQVIKRVMPRQNEQVNELWICDKGRFGYHFTESEQRLTQPLVRQDGELRPASWDEALARVAGQLRQAGEGLLALAGGRLPNEDLFNLRQLSAAQQGKARLYSSMAGGDLVAQYGLAPGSNLGALGPGSVILVAACDLQEEAPLWWLRVRQAAQRGATLIVVNPRPTRLEPYAQHVLRYAYGRETDALAAFLPGAVGSSDEDVRAAAAAFAGAENAVILFGSEGLGLGETQRLAQVCAAALAGGGHVGRPNNGLIGVWPNANTQGAWELGFTASDDLAQELRQASVAYIVAADPAGDDPALATAVEQASFVVVQELFLTETARRADVVLPALAYVEREGTFTSGERRVQRFYQAVPARAGARADYAIFAQLGERLGLDLEGRAPSLVFLRMAAATAQFAGLTYAALAQSVEQWPQVGRQDVYYGGTGYENSQGLGVQLSLPPLPAAAPVPGPAAAAPLVAEGALWVVPVTRLYDAGQTLLPSTLLDQRRARLALWLHPQTAARLGLAQGDVAHLELAGGIVAAPVQLSERLPLDVGHLPRSSGAPLGGPQVARLVSVTRETAAAGSSAAD